MVGKQTPKTSMNSRDGQGGRGAGAGREHKKTQRLKRVEEWVESLRADTANTSYSLTCQNSYGSQALKIHQEMITGEEF